MVNKQLKEYVSLQIKLADIFQEKYGQIKDKFLVNIPKSGEIDSGGSIWHFQKHGAGVIFTEVKTNIKVDINEMLIDSSYFDNWRLRTYFGSLGKRGIKIISSATGKNNINLNDNIKEWLSILLKDGIIEKVDNYYYLKE